MAIFNDDDTDDGNHSDDMLMDVLCKCYVVHVGHDPFFLN